MAHRCVHQLIYSRHREGICWASLILICEVHTHSLLPVLLFHHHNIGLPFRVEIFLDSPCLLELHHLISNNICMFLGWVPW